MDKVGIFLIILSAGRSSSSLDAGNNSFGADVGLHDHPRSQNMFEFISD